MKIIWQYIMAFIFIITCANCARITVGPSGADYASIQSAINNASSGDTIEVYSGIYKENIYINKNISLIGIDNGKGLPKVDAGGRGSAVSLQTDGITLKGFNLTNSGHCGCGNAGILVESDNNTITGNVAFKNKYGIYVRGGKGNLFTLNEFRNNEVSTFDDGENVWDGANLSLNAVNPVATGNEISGNYYSDFDEIAEGCNDTNGDGFCDSPKKIRGGLSVDDHPLAFSSKIL